MASGPRVLFLDQAGEIGGAQLSLLDIAKAPGMSERCHVILFVGGPFEGVLKAHGLSAEVAEGGTDFVKVPRGAGPFRSVIGLGSLFWLAQLATRRARDYDVIYANTQKALLVGAIAARLTDRPLIWHLRDLLDAQEVSNTARNLARFVADAAAAVVVANSKATGYSFRHSGGRAKVAMVYNGIDGALFGPCAGQPQPQLPPFARAGVVVGVYSRLAEWKGQHIVVEALQQLEGVNLMLVGGPLFGAQEYEGRLRRQISDLGLGDRVLMTGARNDVAALMQLCDIVVHTSTSPEPFGRVVLEGMLSGKPVIATDAGGVPELVDDGVTGLLVECGNVDQLAAAIRRLVDEPAFAQQLAAAGRRRAQAGFSVEDYRGQIMTVIDDVHAGRAVSIGL